MRLKSEPFQKIASGEKTVELRLFDDKRRGLNIGDDIIFTNLSDDSEKLAVRITALYRYGSFEDLFAEISPARCGNLNGETIEEAAAGMRKYYSVEQIHDYGVLGIKIELISLEDDEMAAEQIILVVPKPYIASYPRDRQDRVWTLRHFVAFVRETEGV